MEYDIPSQLPEDHLPSPLAPSWTVIRPRVPDNLSLHCELFLFELSNSQGADSTFNIFSWISCRGFNQGIRPTPRTATQSSWLRGSWLPSGIGATWLDAQGEGTVGGLFIFYWTLSTSKPRNISVKAVADTSQSTIRSLAAQSSMAKAVAFVGETSEPWRQRDVWVSLNTHL